MHSNFYSETLTLPAVLLDWCCSLFIHWLYYRHYPFINTQFPQRPSQYFPRHPIKGLFYFTKAIQSSFFFAKYFSCNWRTIKIASVVPLPLINPNCISSIFTMFCTLLSITLSKTNVQWIWRLASRSTLLKSVPLSKSNMAKFVSLPPKACSTSIFSHALQPIFSWPHICWGIFLQLISHLSFFCFFADMTSMLIIFCWRSGRISLKNYLNR